MDAFSFFGQGPTISQVLFLSIAPGVQEVASFDISFTLNNKIPSELCTSCPSVFKDSLLPGSLKLKKDVGVDTVASLRASIAVTLLQHTFSGDLWMNMEGKVSNFDFEENLDGAIGAVCAGCPGVITNGGLKGLLRVRKESVEGALTFEVTDASATLYGGIVFGGSATFAATSFLTELTLSCTQVDTLEATIKTQVLEVIELSLSYRSPGRMYHSEGLRFGGYEDAQEDTTGASHYITPLS